MADARKLELDPPRGFWRGVFESVAVIAGFVAFGLAWAALERGAGRAEESYNRDPIEVQAVEELTPPVEADDATAAQSALAQPRVWLVDGYNALHAGVLRGRDRRDWWKAPAQERLVALAERFEDREAEVWVVFDASEARPERCPAPASGRVRLVFTPSADDWLVRRVRTAPEPARLAVVTADRQVMGRVRHRGAAVVSPLAFLARCGPREGAQTPGDGEPGTLPA